VICLVSGGLRSIAPSQKPASLVRIQPQPPRSPESKLQLPPIRDRLETAGAVVPGVIGCALRVAALADENWGSAGDVDTHWCGRARLGVWRGGLGSVSWQRSLRTDAIKRESPDGGEEGRHGGHVRPGCRSGRREGLGDGVRAHSRPARRPAQRDAHVQDDVRLVAGDAGLAGRSWGDDRGDGVDLDVLEGTVLLPRGSDGGVAAERRAHEGGAGPQKRCARRGVDCAAVGARVVGALICAAAGDPSAADVDPVPTAADGGSDPGHYPVGIDAGGCPASNSPRWRRV
jgi:hypothetical protein